MEGQAGQDYTGFEATHICETDHVSFELKVLMRLR